ncbi:MAG: DJ-1/PfpI family protein [Pseudomonadota bacterium]
METTRRNMLALAGLTPFLSLATFIQRAEAEGYRFGNSEEEANKIAHDAHVDLMRYPGLEMHGDEDIAMICYDGMTMLDLIGPQYFFASMMGARVHLVSADSELKPIMGDTGFAIVPTISMADCPEKLDILFVPGGTMGTVRTMKNRPFIDFIAERGASAKHVTSVCTGSMILGQAGLLKGKRATSHWSARHLLPEFEAIAVDARVVRDGNVTTGAGVSAGLDFAIALLAQMRGDAYAQAVQLQAEYAPEPLFTAGTLDTIDPKLGEPMHEMFAAALYAIKEASQSRL